MSQQDLIQRIHTESQQEITQIHKNAEQEAQTIIQNTKKTAKEQAEQLLEQGKNNAENTKKIIISKAHQEANRKRMQAKENIIETCFTTAQEQLKKLPTAEYKKISTTLIQQAKKRINGPCVIYISRDEDKAIAKKENIPIAGTITASGGSIIQSKDGKLTIDNTFEGLINRHKHELRTEIGKLLFSK